MKKRRGLPSFQVSNLVTNSRLLCFPAAGFIPGIIHAVYIIVTR